MDNHLLNMEKPIIRATQVQIQVTVDAYGILLY